MTVASGSRGGFYRGSLRTVWHVFGQQRGPLLFAIVLRALAAVSMAVPVAVVAWSVDAVRTRSLTSERALVAGLIVVATVVTQYGLWLASNNFAWVGTFLAVGEGRIAALRHVQSLPVGTVADRGTGDLAAVLGADFEQVAVYVHQGMMNLIGGAALPAATVLGLAVVDVPLAAAVALSVVAAVPVFGWVNRTFVRRALARADALAEANARIIEYIQGIATARSNNQTGSRQAWYRHAVAKMRFVNDDLAVKITPLAYHAIGVVFLGTPLVILCCSWWLLDGRIDQFTAVVFLVIVLRVYAPLVSVAVEAEGLRLTDAALHRIGRLLDLPTQPHPTGPIEEPAGHDLTFERVTFGYQPGRPALEDIDFTARAGTVTALVGSSGAGKSTVLALASRFYDPDAGTVRLGGVALSELTADQLHAAVSVVFQDVYLFQGTIRGNIAFGSAQADDAAVAAAARAARCDTFIEGMPQGYATRIGEGGLTLSGGERQRISIARAILKDAPVVLLDEATSALDPLNEQAVQQALAELVRGRTVIVVAHRLSTIRTADHVIVLAGGRIVERGRHEEPIAAAGRYARLWAERERASRWRLDTRT